MRSRRPAVLLPALAAALFAASAFASPSVTPKILQCDGTYRPGGSTRHPGPTIRVDVQDPSGLRIGQAPMGATDKNATRALWRFDESVNISTDSVSGNYIWTYATQNDSPAMVVGECKYSGSTLISSPQQIPLGMTACPSSPPTKGSTTLFQTAHFGSTAAFNSRGDGTTVQFGSVTYNTGLGDRPATYTLSAWIKANSSNGRNQRVISEQNWPQFWGFGLGPSGSIYLFDSRNTSNTGAYIGGGYDDNQWHKIDVVRINGYQERFYADGGFIGFVTATSTDSFAAHPISHPIMIGTFEGGGADSFDGAIDEIRVIDAALTDEEIYLEYQGSNLHKYAGSAAAAYSPVTSHASGRGFPSSVTNGDQALALYTSDETIDRTTAPNQRWIFEAQSTGTLTTITSTFTVTIDQSAPTAPQSLSGTATQTSVIRWSWAAPATYCPTPGSTSIYYQMFDAVSGGAALSPPGNTAATSFDEPLTGSTNTLFSRRLTLTDVWGTSPLTASASAYTLAAVPAWPSSPFASISTGGFVATWSANGNPGYTRYELTDTADPAFLVGVSTRVGLADNFTGASVGVTDLAPGTTYYVRLRAFNGRGSDFYGGLATTPSATASVVTVPSAPSLAGTPLSDSSIQWTWSSVAGAAGYTLYDSASPTVLYGPSAPALSFTSSTLSVNARYDAEVRADAPSPTPSSARSHAFMYTMAKAPGAPLASAVYATSATFTWGSNGNPGYTFYRVLVSTDPLFAVVTATLTVTAPTATATGLLPGGVTYYAQVQAVNGAQLGTAYVGLPAKYTTPDPSISVSSAPASPYVAPAGLAGSWQFDEDAGTTTVDGSGNANIGNFGCATASCVSTPTFASGPSGLGSAASFSGQSGGVVLTANAGPSIAGSVTVEAWVNPATAAQTAGAGIAAKGPKNSEDFALDVSASGAFEFLTSNAGAEIAITAAAAALTAGRWTHVVGVYDSAHTSATLYLNGAAVATNTSMPARANSAQKLAIGNRQDAAGQYTLPFAGRIDAVRVIAAALTAPQVMADYLGGFVSSVTAPSPNNGIIVALPPNAFGAPAQIFISTDPVNHPIRISASALNAGLAVAPSGLTLVPNSLVEVVPVIDGTAFTSPLGSSATLTIPYHDPGNTGLIAGTNPPLTAAGLRMYTLNTAVNSWILLPTAVDRAGHTVSGVTPHFSVFALFAPSTVAASLAGVKAYPTPWKPGSGGRFDAPGVTFANLPASGTIRILTLSGQRVKDIAFNGASSGLAVWDGLNEDGRRTASGVYFARVASGVDGSAAWVKFAIER